MTIKRQLTPSISPKISGKQQGIPIEPRANNKVSWFPKIFKVAKTNVMIAPAESNPLFQPGQLVRHRRYGYRGVIVELDLHCRATDDWYENNQTQPAKNQPWYHVLVDGSNISTYAAQTSLEADTSVDQIDHPMVCVFFSDFTGKAYLRNDRPWT